jgi:Zn-dependent protease with chaperone function
MRFWLYWCLFGSFAYGFWCAQAFDAGRPASAAVFASATVALLLVVSALQRRLEREAVARALMVLAKRKAASFGVVL